MTRALVFGFLFITLSAFADTRVSAEAPALRWSQSESSVSLLSGQEALWQLNHGADLDVPFFHPVSPGGGRVLTWDRPADHAWHHGLWFCWKYINGVNYWEFDRQTGKPQGKTEWTDLVVETRDDHSAAISMTVSYHPVGDDDVVLRERRRIDITAPNSEGQYHMDWVSEFTAGDREVELNRTPPKEQSWGGYAGLSVRFAQELGDRQATSSNGPIDFGPGDRHRSHATSMDYSGVIDGEPVGLAFLDHPDNPRHPTPWYVIRGAVMGYINAALLNDEPMILPSGKTMNLRYRLVVHPQRWDAARLKTAEESFWRSVSPKKD